MLQGCGSNYHYRTLDDISSNYIEWVKETRMTEASTAHLNSFLDYPSDKTVIASFANKAKPADYNREYDELKTIMKAHNAFVTCHKDYFPPESIIKFNACFTSSLFTDISFMTAYENSENMSALGESYDNIIKFASIDIYLDHDEIIDEKCSFDIPYVILRVDSYVNGAKVPSKYEILKAFPNAKKVIIDTTSENYDKDTIISNVKNILPNCEIIFSYCGEIQ